MSLETTDSTPPIFARLGSSWRTPCPCRCSMRSAQFRHGGTRWAALWGRPWKRQLFTSGYYSGKPWKMMDEFWLTHSILRDFWTKTNREKTCHAMCHAISYTKIIYIVYHKTHIKNQTSYFTSHITSYRIITHHSMSYYINISLITLF